MKEVIETNVLLEENFEAAKKEIRELDHQAWMAMKSLGHKDGSFDDFDPIRYTERKRKLLETLPIIESKLRKARIAHLQERRVELQKELESIMPEQLKTKALVHEAQKLLDEAWQNHARLDLKAAAIEGELVINFENTRTNQRALQNLIRDITGMEEDMDHNDGLSANERNLLIRGN